jgi:alpha-maltose-1-phosphate synthase
MKIVLSVICKFHTFDLARQLHSRGALTAIFSGYPRFKLENERLPQSKIFTFPWVFAPYARLAPRSYRLRWLWDEANLSSLDWYVASRLPECDVVMSLSGCGLRTGRVARSRGVKYICDRGSAHIRVQDELLREEYDRQGIRFPGINPKVIAREEAEYVLADIITIPSTFALNSFLARGISREKLRLTPYGVDLSLFHPTTVPSTEEFRVLFVGAISVQKGVRYLLEAFEKLNHPRKRLTLVGRTEPALEPWVQQLKQRPDVMVTGHVPQPRLKEYMSASHVMVLPSIQEGLALVQAQAMACGCPVISSQNTGGSDLFTDGLEGFITPIRDSGAIAYRLQLLADDPDLRARMSAAALERVKKVSGWHSYGDTMYAIFSEICNRKPSFSAAESVTA